MAMLKRLLKINKGEYNYLIIGAIASILNGAIFPVLGNKYIIF